VPAAPFKFTAERIAAVKAIAAAKGTAREAAEAVGLDPEREYLVYKLARREGFKFMNLGRKRDDRAIFVRLDDMPSTILTERARQAGIPPPRSGRQVVEHRAAARDDVYRQPAG